MDTTSVAYVLCRIEDDSSLTPISEHQDIVGGVAAGKHQVEVEDFDFSYGLFSDGAMAIVNRAPMEQCLGCSQMFIRESRKQKYCSKSCASTSRWRRWKDRQIGHS